MDTDSAVALSLTSLNFPDTGLREKNIPQKNVDRGYAWVIMLAAFASFLVCAANVSTATLLYQELLVKFELSATTAGWVVSSSTSIRLLSSPFVGLLCQRFTLRAITITGGSLYALGILLTAFASELWMLYLGYGLLAGVGGNMLVMSSFIIVAQYFLLKRGLALSFALCGNGIGSMIFPPLVTMSFRSFGYTQTVIFIACVMLQNIVTGSLYRPQTLTKQPEGLDDSSKSKWQHMKDKFGLHLLGQPMVLFLLIVIASMQCMVSIGQIFISGLAIERANMSPNEIATALSIAAFSEFCKLPVGFCFDLPKLRPHRMYLFCGACIIMGLLAVVMALSSGTVAFTVLFAVYVFFAMGAHSQYITVMGDVVALDQLPHALALCRTLMGVALLFVPVAIGRIKDVLDSFQYGFILLSIVHTSIVVTYVIVYYCWNRRKSPGSGSEDGAKVGI